MKRIVLTISLAVLVLFAFASCEMTDITCVFGSLFDSKGTVNPPELLELYQDEYGNVNAKYSRSVDNQYGVQFSLDGETWCASSSYENNDATLIRFETTNNPDGEFVYRTVDGQELTLAVGDTVMIGLRECETKDTHASDAGNLMTITLKKPQKQPNLWQGTATTEPQEEYTVSENDLNEVRFSILYDLKTEKFVIATTQYENATPSGLIPGDYTCRKVSVANAALANKLEFAYLDAATADDANARGVVVADLEKAGTLTFSPFTSASFELNEDYAYESQMFYGKKVVTMAIRYREDSQSLASPALIVDIEPYAVSYGLSSDPSQFPQGTMLEVNAIPGAENATLWFRESTAQMTLADLQKSFVVYASDNYSSTAGQKAVSGITVTVDGFDGAALTTAQIGQTYTVTIKNGDVTLFTLPLAVALFAN